jgi:hypothetical protein
VVVIDAGFFSLSGYRSIASADIQQEVLESSQHIDTSACIGRHQ